jgi:hypothetical protein
MNKIFSSLVVILALAFLGCEGDVKKASGNYEVTVVAPNGHSDVGSGTVSNSGDFFSIVINSSVGNFAVAGTLNNNVIETEFTDASGGAATARFQFSVDRSTFTGTIQTTTGLFVFRGTKLSPLT